MVSGIGTLEYTAVTPVKPAPPVFGRGGFIIGEPGKASSRAGRSARDAGDAGVFDPTDATGLSLSSDEVRDARERFEREWADTASERAYIAAGREAGRAGRGEAANAGLAGAAPASMGDAAAASDAFFARQTETPGHNAQPERREPGDAGRVGGTDPNGATGPNRTAGPSGSGGPNRSGGATSGEEARSAGRTFMGAADGSAGRSFAGSDEGAAQGDQQKQLAEMTAEEKLQVRDMKARDQEVRTHEQAHMGAGAGLVVGGASFQQERGPDGRMYAVAGEVQIDTSEGASPEETLDKARRVRAAALAPAEPSGQDRLVAAQAASMESEARREMHGGASGGISGGISGRATGQSGDTPLGQTADARQPEAGKRSTAQAADADAAGVASGASNDKGDGQVRRAAQAYERTAGGALRFPAPWGTGISFAV